MIRIRSATRPFQRQLQKQVYQRPQLLRQCGIFLGPCNTSYDVFALSSHPCLPAEKQQHCRWLSTSSGGKEEDHSLPEEGEYVVMAHAIIAANEVKPTGGDNNHSLPDQGEYTITAHSINIGVPSSQESSSSSSSSNKEVDDATSSSSKPTVANANKYQSRPIKLNEFMPLVAEVSANKNSPPNPRKARPNNPKYLFWRRQAEEESKGQERQLLSQKRATPRPRNPKYFEKQWRLAEEESKRKRKPRYSNYVYDNNKVYNPRYSDDGQYLNNRARKQFRQRNRQMAEAEAKYRSSVPPPPRGANPPSPPPPRRRRHRRNNPTIADQLQADKDTYVPRNPWVVITGIPPVSTLDSMLQGINQSLDRELVERGGILNLEADLHPKMMTGEIPLPLLPYRDLFPKQQQHLMVLAEQQQQQQHNVTTTESAPSGDDVDGGGDDDQYRWIQEARLLLSAFGRPYGWKIKFANRSIAYALLQSTQKKERRYPLKCGWKIVTAHSFDENEFNQNKGLAASGPLQTQKAHVEICFDKPPPPAAPAPKLEEQQQQQQQQSGGGRTIITPFGHNHLYYDDLDTKDLDWLDDSVVRVENPDGSVNEEDLIFLFSRYDLKAPSVVRWIGKKADGGDPPPTFFVRFMDAHWARAAVRAKQGVTLGGGGGKPLRMVQFPKQFIPTQKKPTAPTTGKGGEAQQEREEPKYMEESA